MKKFIKRFYIAACMLGSAYGLGSFIDGGKAALLGRWGQAFVQIPFGLLVMILGTLGLLRWVYNFDLSRGRVKRKIKILEWKPCLKSRQC